MSQTTTTFDNSFATDLATESWTLYGIGVLLFTLRVITKFRFHGWRNLDADDYVATVAIGLYTGLIVCLNVIASEIKDRIWGSKIVIVSEQCMLNVIYCLKACVLLFYLRLTQGVSNQKFVYYIAIAAAIGWVSTEIAFFTACRPFSGYWAVPPPNPQCTTLEHYAEVQACFNIPTDLAMLGITIPLVHKLRISLKQKIMIGGLFSMGLFVVIAAILTKVYNLSDVYSTSYMLWYVREASVATYVANLPSVWPLLRHIFPCLSGGTGNRSSNKYKPSGFTGTATNNRTKRTNNMVSHLDPEEQGGVFSGPGGKFGGLASVGGGKKGSEAHIMELDERALMRNSDEDMGETNRNYITATAPGSRGATTGPGIEVSTTVEVMTDGRRF